MQYFSVPADFNEETIDKYFKLNSKYKNKCVKETYGQITTDNKLSSGRLSVPKVNFDKLERYVKYSKKKGIDFSYTLNGLSMNNMEFTKDGIEDIVSFLHKIYNLGIRNLTVAMPSLIELIISTNLNFNIKASTICQITNSNKADNYKRLGVNRIVVDESINRKFNNLKDIRNSFGENVEIIVNSICNKDCIYRMFHYNQIANDYPRVKSNAGIKYYPNRCMLWRYNNISNILKLAWIRPEDIKYYSDIGINFFKIQGRQLVLVGNPVRTIECYFKESFDGNLFELLNLFTPNFQNDIFIDNKKLDGFIIPFVKGKLCNSNCNECSYCVEKANSIGLQKQYKLKNIINDYISKHDDFTKMVKFISKN